MKKEYKVMFGLIGAAVTGAEPDPEVIKEADRKTLDSIFKICRAHSVAQIVADVISKYGLLPEDDDLYKKYKSCLVSTIYQTTLLDHWHGMVMSTLDEAGIDHIAIKGAAVRKLYAKGFYRNSCDIDILIRESDLERGVAVLTEKLGMTAKDKGSHDVSLYYRDKVHVELHYDTVEKGRLSDADGLLSRIWEHAVPVSGHEYALDDEMNYFYLTAHAAKHLKNGGCGIKTLTDALVLNRVPGFDREKREALLKEGGLLKFDSAVRALCDHWFYGKDADDTVTRFGEYLLNGGRYGTLENNVTLKVSKSGKSKYLLSRIFMPYDALKFKYPVLQKHKWLYPFMVVRRIFSLIDPEVRRRSSNELKASVNVTKDEETSASDLMSSLGLQ